MYRCVFLGRNTHRYIPRRLVFYISEDKRPARRSHFCHLHLPRELLIHIQAHILRRVEWSKTLVKGPPAQVGHQRRVFGARDAQPHVPKLHLQTRVFHGRKFMLSAYKATAAYSATRSKAAATRSQTRRSRQSPAADAAAPPPRYPTPGAARR